LRYAEIAKLSQAVFMPEYSAISRAELAKRIHDVVNSPGLTPYVDAMVFVQMGTDGFLLPDKIALGERVMTTFSSPGLVAKLATLYGLDRRPEQAARTFARLCAYFPDDCINAADNVRVLQKQHPKEFDPVARRFFAMPQSKIQPISVNVLKPWEHGATGTVVAIDPKKTLFGFDLALYASGLAQMGMKSGTFLATPTRSGATASAPAASTPRPEE
jgi:hypothetical protein